MRDGLAALLPEVHRDARVLADVAAGVQVVVLLEDPGLGVLAALLDGDARLVDGADVARELSQRAAGPLRATFRLRLARRDRAVPRRRFTSERSLASRGRQQQRADQR